MDEKRKYKRKTMDLSAALTLKARLKNVKLRPTLQVKAHKKSCWGICMVPLTFEGKRLRPSLITWGRDGTVNLWNAFTGDSLGRLYQGHNGNKGEMRLRQEP